MRWDRNSVSEGMFVTSTKGERIGKVIRRDGSTFVVEKGTLFPKDYELRYDHIAAIDGGAITYSLVDLVGRTDRPASTTIDTPAAAASLAATAPVEKVAKIATPAQAPARAFDSDNEVRIPLMQEEVEIEKVPHESGHVRIHKGVKTEERHFTVPVRREEIVIEHVTAFAGGAGTGEEGTFEERVIDIALYEEEIRVTKRPVLREEIVVRTVAHSIEKEATATLRHEEADVEDTRKTSDTVETSPSEGYGAPGRR